MSDISEMQNLDKIVKVCDNSEFIIRIVYLTLSIVSGISYIYRVGQNNLPKPFTMPYWK